MTPTPFKLKRRRKIATTRGIFRKAEQLKDPKDEPPFFIRGIQAMSKEEYWVSLALEKLEQASGLTWQYQVPMYGGRTRAGGSVVDFIVYIGARVVWLDPMGRYWHSGKNEDRMQMWDAARKKGAELLAWFTDETPTKEIMYTFLKGKLGA